jgi:hypothetical protein
VFRRGVSEREEKFSSNLPSVGHEHILHAHSYYHQERENEMRSERCLLVSFSLLLILMMMMFRTVLLFFFLSLYRYITKRKKKDRHFFEGRQDVLIGGTVRIEQRNGYVPFFFYKKKLLLFFLLFFLFALTLAIMFTIACIMLLCAYFQGSLLLLRFCLTRRWEKKTRIGKKRRGVV